MTEIEASAILERARREGTPVLDRNTATFVWEGPTAPILQGDFTDWAREDAVGLELEPDGPNLWTRQVELSPDAYMEYMYFQGDTRMPDPLSRKRVSNGLGKFNHYFYMPEGSPTELVRARRGIPRGTVTRHRLAPSWRLTGGWTGRDLYLYRPPVEGPVPLILVYDGPDYLRRARLPVIVDNLIAAGRIRPVALALLANAGRDRIPEYSCGESLLGYIKNELLGFVRGQLDLVDPTKEPGGYGVLGASMGGLMALYTGLRMPELFGKVLSQSGAFSIFDHENVVYPLVEHLPPPAINIWMDCGQYEWLLDTNRRMAGLLKSKGYPIEYREYPAGHNYPAWRNDLWRGLEHLYGTGA